MDAQTGGQNGERINSKIDKKKSISGAAKATQNHIAYTAPTDTCSVERNNSKNKVDATPEFQPSDLIGRTFFMNAQPDGQQFRVTIAKAITQHQHDHANQPELVEFRIPVNDDQCEETMTYYEILYHIDKEENNSAESPRQCRKRIGHEGPSIPSTPSHSGSWWNVYMEWENGHCEGESVSLHAAHICKSRGSSSQGLLWDLNP